jgi:oxygen-independent coproporphyrinogen-3 oxidase
MYRLAQQLLTDAGYDHYEISNYALPTHQCRHNRVYWENRSFYGFGMGAASYIQGRRFTRPRTRREYYAWVEQFIQAGGVLESLPSSTTDILLETVMLGLRLADGLSLSALREKFGETLIERIWRSLQPSVDKGWIKIVNPDGSVIDMQAVSNRPISGRIRLSDPDGFLFSNTILADIFKDIGEG